MVSPDDMEMALKESLEHWKAMLDKIVVLQDKHFAILPPSLQHRARSGKCNLYPEKTRALGLICPDKTGQLPR